VRRIEELREAVPADVAAAVLGVLRVGQRVRDVGRAFLAEPDVRQLLVEGDVAALDDDVLAGRLRPVDELGRNPLLGIAEDVGVVQLGLAPVAMADGHRGAFARTERVEQDRHALRVDAVDVVQDQRRPVLAADVVHQRLQLVRAAAAVERHVQVLELTFLFQQREELAHVLERH
jgi:hypothetical protein